MWDFELNLLGSKVQTCSLNLNLMILLVSSTMCFRLKMNHVIHLIETFSRFKAFYWTQVESLMLNWPTIGNLATWKAYKHSREKGLKRLVWTWLKSFAGTLTFFITVPEGQIALMGCEIYFPNFLFNPIRTDLFSKLWILGGGSGEPPIRKIDIALTIFALDGCN